MSDDLLQKLHVELELLKIRLDVQENFIKMLMVMLPEDKRSDMEGLFTAFQVNAVALDENNHGEFIAEGMKHFRARIDALGDSPANARLTLLSLALMVSSVPEHHKKAMETWLTQAHAEEIQDELLQAFLQSSVADNKDSKKE